MHKRHKDNYMEVATLVASFSSCVRRKIGAVLVKDGNIVSTGYNGTISGADNTCEINGSTREDVLHSEANCILACARLGIATNNTTLFITVSPCVGCAKLIMQAGIKEVYYKEDYRDMSGRDLLLLSNKVKIAKLVWKYKR